MSRVELVQPGSGKVFGFAEERVADALRRGFTYPKPAPARPAPKRKPKTKAKKQ